MEDSELAAVGFPCERNDAFCRDKTHKRIRVGISFGKECKKVTFKEIVLTLHLHHIDRNLLLSHAEDFKVGDDALFFLIFLKEVESEHFLLFLRQV